MDVTEVAADLIAEQQALDDVVSGLSDEQWALATASPGWTVADQIAHLAYFDRAAAVAISDPERFQEMIGELFSAGSAAGVDEVTLGPYRNMDSDGLLLAWRADRAALAEAAAALENSTRVAWYGPSMGSKSFLTARLMEAWAHGQDIVDVVAAAREPSDRLRHIAQLGVITRGWSYMNRKTDMPDTDVRVSLKAPSGESWDYGPADAPDSVTGSAEDFCLVVTQRRHVDSTELVTTGDAARDWMLIAQAFAGQPTDGPNPAA